MSYLRVIIACLIVVAVNSQPPDFSAVLKAFQDFGTTFEKVTKAACGTPPAADDQLESLKNELITSLQTELKEVESLSKIVEAQASSQPNAAQILANLKKGIDDATTFTNSNIEKIKATTSIAELCNLIKSQLQELETALEDTFKKIIDSLPECFKNLLNGFLNVSEVLATLSSNTTKPAESDLQKLIKDASDALNLVLKGLQCQLAQIKPTDPAYAAFEKMIKIVQDTITKVTAAKSTADLSQILTDFIKSLMGPLQGPGR